MYELGKNKYILGRKPFLLGGGVPLSCPCRLRPHPALDSGRTHQSGLLPPNTRGPGQVEGQRGVCCGGPGSVCGLGCAAGLFWEPSEVWQGDTWKVDLSSQPSWGSSGFQLFGVEGQYLVFCLSSLLRMEMSFIVRCSSAQGSWNGFNYPHHHEFLDLDLKAVEHTWDFLCVRATSSESLDLSVSLFLH